ncbi:hypothetical protein BH11ACT8_BH11ACT8_26040 [soil metagenome]
MSRTPSSRRRRQQATLGVAALALIAAGLSAGQATAGPGSPATAAPATASPTAAGKASNPLGTKADADESASNYDSRTLSSSALSRQARSTQKARGAASAKLADSIGNDASVSLDALSGTPTEVSSRLGFLTGPSKRPAAEIALGFVRSHLDGFGLERADLSTLVKTRQFTDINKITHVFWTQEIQGIPVFGNGLRAHVDRNGRLISVQGAPVSGASGQVARAASPRVTRAGAIKAAVRDARGTSARDGASASRVWFLTPGGLRAGWSTYTQPSGTEAYQHVIDATTGRTLYRHSTINFERGDAYVHENYPGARGSNSGGKQHVVNLFRLHYLPRTASWMRGRYASVWADLNDDDALQNNEKTRVPKLRHRPQFKLRPFKTAAGETPCTVRFQCTWDPSTRYSWRTNKNQDGVQSLYFTSKYAEWLKMASFGFTAALGNFERKGCDEVHVQTMDGGNTAGGLPDGAHVNNANFNTPPDGQAPIMQMYLNYSPYLAASSSNAFDNIGHEYTHGLSNRLVVDSLGNSTLNSYQGGGMGEGWSDFYSFDYLLAHKLITNDPNKSGELMYDRYLSKDRAYTRSEAIDCAVGDNARLCKQVGGVGVGGYTYGDIPGQLTTEVHAAGEVWAQTLWDVHEMLGHQVTMRLVTSAMTLSPNDPSMLDMRDAIITADKAIYSKAHTAKLWKAFAARGFGYFAASIDGGDATPVEDFHVPPAGNQAPGAIDGTVTDGNGDPVVGAVVLVAGHTSGVVGSYSDVTGADGSYSIGSIVPGTYPKVVAFADGYENTPQAVTVTPGGTTTADFTLRRDWAAASGGASIDSFDGVDYTPYGCGPGGLIDLSQGTGWGSTTGPTEDPVTSLAEVDPKSIVVALPQAVNITSVAVDPGSTCGDPGSSSTADYTIEVAASAGGPYTQVASGTFGASDRGVLTEIPVAAPGTQFVRYTMVTPQVPDFAGCPNDYGGCTYMDTSELAVYDD